MTNRRASPSPSLPPSPPPPQPPPPQPPSQPPSLSSRPSPSLSSCPSPPFPSLPPSLSSCRTRAAQVVILVAAALGLAVMVFWGRRLNVANPAMQGSGSPWLGHWRFAPAAEHRWWVLCPIAVGAAVVAGWPRVCRRWSWSGLLAAVPVTAGAWTVAVACIDGPSDVAAPLRISTEYLAALPQVTSLGTFLSTYVERLGDYPIHVQGHPPGQVLLLWLLDRVGLGGAWPATVQTIMFAVLAGVGVLTVVRWECGEAVARRAAVFVGFAPATWTIATSSDATFCGVAVAANVAGFAAQRAAGWRAIGLGVATGVAAASLCFLTYGGPLFLGPLLIPCWRVLQGRRWGLVLAATAGFSAVVAAFTTSGFWWFDGLAATRRAYASGIALHRPFSYFVVANLWVLAVMVGPAALAGMVFLRRGSLATLVAAAALGVAVADLSGLSKAEVERIWLPFVPWLVLIAALQVRRWPMARWWLAAQLVPTVVLPWFFVGQW